MDSAAVTLSAKLFSFEWLPIAFKLYRSLRRFIKQESHEGQLEVVKYDSTLELTDPRGETAVFKKRLRVKFIQDYVIAFQDFAWGEGDVLAAYHCSPGVEVDRYQEGNRWNVLISLRETKNSGDIEDFYIERQVKSGFTKNEEWCQVEMQHPTRWLKLSVMFPPERHCKRAVLIERKRNRTTMLDARSFTDLPDGRQLLTWETNRPRRFETYTLQWRW
jgi:hypothetical protein